MKMLGLSRLRLSYSFPMSTIAVRLKYESYYLAADKKKKPSTKAGEDENAKK